MAPTATVISARMRSCCRHSRRSSRSAQRMTARRAGAPPLGRRARPLRYRRGAHWFRSGVSRDSGPGRDGLVGHPAVAQEHHPVRPGRELRVVRHHDRGHPGVLARVVEQAHHRLGVDRVERAGRLVGQQQPPFAHHRPRDRDPLPFAARHLVRVVGGALGQAEPLQRLERRGPGLAAGHPVQLERQRDVLRRGQPGQQVEVLEYVADHAPPQPRLGAAGHPADRLAGDEHVAAGRLLQGPGDGQQRALARAARSHHRHHRAFVHRQADLVQGVHLGAALPVGLRYLAQL